MSRATPNVHDSTLRAMFGTTEVARAFFCAFLPAELLERLDLATLETKPDHFIDARLGWRATDLLFRVDLDRREAFLYLLLEHQSTVDRWMAYRFSRSIGLVWATALADAPDLELLPVVVPMVLSHARERWRSPTQLRNLVAGADLLPACMHDKIPSLSYFVFDLRAMTDAQIVSLATTASLRLYLLIMRNIRNPDLPAMLRRWHELIRGLMQEPTGLRLIELLLTYLVKAVPEMTQETLVEVGEMAGLDPEIVPNSLAWKWLQEGREEGREEGRKEGRKEGSRSIVLRLVRARFGEVPPFVQERVQAASLRELDELSEHVLTAESIDDLFT